MTEVQRYEKRGDNSTLGQKKGGNKKTPQEAWMDLVHSAVGEAPAHLKSQLSIIAGLDNVPRKEKQFRNFASNSLNLHRGTGANVVSEIWTLLKSRQQQVLDERKKVEEQQASEKQSKISSKAENGQSVVTCKDIIESSTATTTEVITSESESTETSGATVDVEATEKESSDNMVAAPEITKKSVRKAMKTVLKKSKSSLSTKRLRKAVELHMGVSKCSKKAIKSMIGQNLNHGNGDKKLPTFMLEGKNISLRK
jgi:hypothetical protein